MNYRWQDVLLGLGLVLATAAMGILCLVVIYYGYM